MHFLSWTILHVFSTNNNPSRLMPIILVECNSIPALIPITIGRRNWIIIIILLVSISLENKTKMLPQNLSWATSRTTRKQSLSRLKVTRITKIGTFSISVDGQKNSFNSPSPRSLQARVGSPRTSSSPNMPSDNGNLARTLDMTEKMMQQFCLGK